MKLGWRGKSIEKSHPLIRLIVPLPGSRASLSCHNTQGRSMCWPDLLLLFHIYSSTLTLCCICLAGSFPLPSAIIFQNNSHRPPWKLVRHYCFFILTGQHHHNAIACISQPLLVLFVQSLCVLIGRITVPSSCVMWCLKYHTCQVVSHWTHYCSLIMCHVMSEIPYMSDGVTLDTLLFPYHVSCDVWNTVHVRWCLTGHITASSCMSGVDWNIYVSCDIGSISHVIVMAETLCMSCDVTCHVMSETVYVSYNDVWNIAVWSTGHVIVMAETLCVSRVVTCCLMSEILFFIVMSETLLSGALYMTCDVSCCVMSETLYVSCGVWNTVHNYKPCDA